MLLVAAMAFLAACETAPPLPEGTPEQAWQSRLLVLDGFDTWRWVGRMAVNDGKDGFSASLRWHQAAASYDIRLTGPLGQGLAHIVGSPDGVAMRTREEGTRVAPTPEALLEQSLGWPLPVSGLRFWMVGLPVPNTDIDSREIDAWGRLVTLEQLGWRIRYQTYTRVDGVDLPARLELEHRPLSARISVTSWQPGP